MFASECANARAFGDAVARIATWVTASYVVGGRLGEVRATELGKSVFALDQVACDGFQTERTAAIRLERGEGFIDKLRCVAQALLNAVNGWPCGLFGGRVFACGFAQLR